MLRLTEVAKIVGLKADTIIREKKRLGLKTKFRLSRHTAGKPATLYTAPQCVGLVLGRVLSSIGIAGQFRDAVTRYCWSMSQEDMEANIAHGRKYILTIANTALPKLITLDAVRNPEGIPPEIAAALHPKAVNIATVWEQIRSQIESSCTK